MTFVNLLDRYIMLLLPAIDATPNLKTYSSRTAFTMPLASHWTVCCCPQSGPGLRREGLATEDDAVPQSLSRAVSFASQSHSPWINACFCVAQKEGLLCGQQIKPRPFQCLPAPNAYTLASAIRPCRPPNTKSKSPNQQAYGVATLSLVGQQ